MVGIMTANLEQVWWYWLEETIAALGSSARHDGDSGGRPS